MISLKDAWQMVQKEHGRSGYYMAAQFEYYRMMHHLSVKGLMVRLSTTETGIICLARCGNPSPSEPGYFAKLEELCGIYGADVDALEKILRYGEKESPNTPANGGNDVLE